VLVEKGEVGKGVSSGRAGVLEAADDLVGRQMFSHGDGMSMSMTMMTTMGSLMKGVGEAGFLDMVQKESKQTQKKDRQNQGEMFIQERFSL